MTDRLESGISRRRFLKTSLGAATVAGFPTIVPATVLGQMAPSKRINVGAIGVGRISRGHDLPAILKNDGARVMAVVYLDAGRREDGKKLLNDFYPKKAGRGHEGGSGGANYHELLRNKDIETVVISKTDHQHA